MKTIKHNNFTIEAMSLEECLKKRRYTKEEYIELGDWRKGIKEQVDTRLHVWLCNTSEISPVFCGLVQHNASDSDILNCVKNAIDWYQ